MGGGEGGAYSRRGVYFKFLPIGEEGCLFEGGGGGALIRRFTVYHLTIMCTLIGQFSGKYSAVRFGKILKLFLSVK